MSLRESWFSRRGFGLGALAIISVLASPAAAVYELFLGLSLVVTGYVARRVPARPLVGTTVKSVGMALLAGPVAYVIAWLLVELFNR